MKQYTKEKHLVFLVIIALAGWFVPGAGYFLLKQRTHAIIIFTAIVLTFCVGLYIGSIGVVDYHGSRPWYTAQIMTSPAVAVIEHYTKAGGYPVFGRPNEIGQIYTGIAGLLNLLCIVNAVYLAHLRVTGKTEAEIRCSII